MRTDSLDQIVRALQEVASPNHQPVSLHQPEFSGNEWTYVKECIDTGWVSSVGKYVDLFESKLAEYSGVKKAVAVVNGTAALHVSLLLAGVEPNDEVLLPALTFVATANAVSYCGAIPHFVDSEWASLGMDSKKLDDYLASVGKLTPDGLVNKWTGRRIKAVLPMHTFGHPVDLDSLTEVADRYRLVLIEDAAESLGSFYKGKHTGHWGRISALSFNGNKIVTTGGGGALLTNDEELGKMAKHITTTAKIPHRWNFFHDQIGYNYRMPNLNAALGCAQLEQLDRFVDQKRKLASVYERKLIPINDVRFIMEPEHTRSNYWLNAILLTGDLANRRDELLEKTNKEGIMTRPAWTLMHKLPAFQHCPKMDLSVAEDLEKSLVNIPSSAFLGGRDE